MLQIRWSRDRVVFDMGIPYLERRSLYWDGAQTAVNLHHLSLNVPLNNKTFQYFYKYWDTVNVDEYICIEPLANVVPSKYWKNTTYDTMRVILMTNLTIDYMVNLVIYAHGFVLFVL